MQEHWSLVKAVAVDQGPPWCQSLLEPAQSLELFELQPGHRKTTAVSLSSSPHQPLPEPRTG